MQCQLYVLYVSLTFPAVSWTKHATLNITKFHFVDKEMHSACMYLCLWAPSLWSAFLIPFLFDSELNA